MYTFTHWLIFLSAAILRFIGTIAVDVFFTDISKFLLRSYKGTDKLVFIVDKPTLSLLGNSLGANIYSGSVDNPASFKMEMFSYFLCCILH